MLESCPTGASLTSNDNFATPIYSPESPFPTAVVSAPAPPARFEKPLLPQLQPVPLATPRVGMKKGGVFASSSNSDTDPSPRVGDTAWELPAFPAFQGHVTNFQFLILTVLFAVVVIMFQYKISKMNENINMLHQTLMWQRQHTYHQNHHPHNPHNPHHQSHASHSFYS